MQDYHMKQNQNISIDSFFYQQIPNKQINNRFKQNLSLLSPIELYQIVKINSLMFDPLFLVVNDI